MPKAKGTGGSHGNRMSRLGLLPKDPSQPGAGLGETPSIPVRCPNRRGGEAGGQGSGTPTAGSMDKVAKHSGVQNHQASCRQIWFLVQSNQSVMPSQAQPSFMHEGRVKHHPGSFALEEAHYNITENKSQCNRGMFLLRIRYFCLRSSDGLYLNIRT